MDRTKELESMSLAQLAETFNNLCPEKAVKRFASRADGVKRLLAALGAEKSVVKAPEEAAPHNEEKPAVKPARKPKITPKAASTPRETKAEHRPPTRVAKRPSHPESKRGKFIARLESASGISPEEAEAEFGWSPNDVRDVLGQLSKRQGYHLQRGDDGRWHVAM